MAALDGMKFQQNLSKFHVVHCWNRYAVCAKKLLMQLAIRASSQFRSTVPNQILLDQIHEIID